RASRRPPPPAAPARSRRPAASRRRRPTAAGLRPMRRMGAAVSRFGAVARSRQRPGLPARPARQEHDRMPVTGTEEALWREYRSRLFGFVRKRVADETTAEDIVHDVLMRALEKRDTLRSADRFEQWL